MEAKVSEPTRLEELLAAWDDNTENHEVVPNRITVSNTLSNVTLSSPYTFTSAAGTSFPNSIWTTTSTGTASPWITTSPNGPATASTKIHLNGENADIEVNGWSLVQAVKRIEERLDLFQLNPELEKEWEDLRELGEQYRKLEQYIRDKKATFDRLRAMPAPDVD